MSSLVCSGCGKKLELDEGKPVKLPFNGGIITNYPCRSCGKLHFSGDSFLVNNDDEEIFLTDKGLEYFPQTSTINN